MPVAGPNPDSYRQYILAATVLALRADATFCYTRAALAAAEGAAAMAGGRASSEALEGARAAHERAAAALKMARYGVEAAHTAPRRDAAIARLSALESEMLMTLRELNAISPPKWPLWGASGPLRDELHRIAAQRQEI